MKTILVTGGAGFIGSHTCLVLLQNGFEVFVIDSFINSSSESLERVLRILKKDNDGLKNKLHIYVGDLKSQKKIETILNWLLIKTNQLKL